MENERIRVRLVMEEDRRGEVYPPEVLAAIDRIADVVLPPLTATQLAEDPDALEDVDVLLTGWGAPVLDAALLARAPRLRALLHAAGSVKHIVTDASWSRGVVVVSAAAANAEPVAELTAAQIVLAARGVPASRRTYHARRDFSARESTAFGASGRTVGLLALGEIGRRVAGRLAGTALTLLAHDPYADTAQAAALGLELVDLGELFERSDVVSLHAPLLPATTSLVGRELIERMPRGATLINTARGGLIDEAGLISALRDRPDLTALLDVTVEEPPRADSELWELPNVELTPHLAGSMGGDRAAMGRLVAEELERLIQGVPLQHEVARDRLDLLA
ncbi:MULTISPECIES: hydroxyacid dehydrogenase [unclassified Microbacterium]|uniref:hydroxyacid dehydrogenase n=1 Tax=unclassified Microbacterium TaxID=2609290 RepID=UPI0012FBDF65|nr:hydroxyacid dehydrogenase [Microbacterium sp. MAH-37]MVQ41370.1 oxidoreductase [Microbacterium sp. MAH-37]